MTERMAVIGAGTMGTGIAYVFAVAGYEAGVVEPDAARFTTLQRDVAQAAAGGVRRGRLDESTAAALPGRITHVADVAELAEGLDLIVESVPEDLELKRRILVAAGPTAPIVNIGVDARRSAHDDDVVPNEGARMANPVGLGRTSQIADDSDEPKSLRESVSKLVGGYGRTYFRDVVKRGAKPDELWADMGAAGFLGVHLPEEYGGGGGGLADLAVVIEEMAAQGCPMFMIVISPAICGSVLAAHGSDVLKDRYLAGIADGSIKMAFAITEPDAGSNTHKITTTARRDPETGGWRITGQKYWTSGVDEAEALLVVARDAEPGPDGRNTLSLFVVETSAPGLQLQEIDSALQLPEKQFVTFFDDVPVKPDGLIGEEGQGLKQVFAGLNPERVAAACVANGIGRYALARAAEYARDRQVWKTPIGAHQGVAHPLAESYIAIELSRLMTMRAAVMADEGLDAAEASNIAKFAAGDACTEALDRAIQVHGGNGLSNEYGLSDLWFTARMFKTAPVSREMVLNHIAQHSLGLPKSY